MTTDGIPLPKVVPLNTLSVTHYDDTDKSSESDSTSDSSNPRTDDESKKKTTKSRKSFKSWRRDKRVTANHNHRMKECVTTAQWLQYVGAFDANRKMVANWGENMQHILHSQPPHSDIKQTEVVKSPKSRKFERRKKNREALKAERQARKDLKNSQTQSPDIDINPAPERFKAFTIGDRHLVFDKAKQKPSEGSTSGYDGPAEVKEVDLAAEGEDPKPIFIATDLSHLE